MFTERQHAFISATFYRLMKEADLHDYEAVFNFAKRKYAEERGSRMAQRALRDGKELDFASYREYGEWAFTPEVTEDPNSCSTQQPENDDLKMTIQGCPWSSQYKEMGLAEGGMLYCSGLDISIVRGFNPALRYEVTQMSYGGNEVCIQYQRDAKLSQSRPKRPENIRDFRFHCAHIYFTFEKLITAIYKTEGAVLSAKMLEAFAEAYGRENADALLLYRGHDFTLIDD
ncbi:L-2-amino-thiazoline-4-carboxylic acid hydrolase [Acidaminobacterium chupaoyuni]